MSDGRPSAARGWRRRTLAEGWRLYSDSERRALPLSRRIPVVVVASVVSVGMAVVATLPPLNDIATASADRGISAFAFGLLFGCLAAVVAVLVASRLSRRAQQSSGELSDSSRYGPGGILADGVWAEIGAAYREGREPTSSLDERLKARQIAEFQRLVVPGQTRLGLAFAPIIVPIVLLMIITWPTFVLILAPLYWIAYSFVRVVGSLWALGRTSAAIATAPEVPEGYTPAPPKKRGWVPPKPYKPLGTSNPDDYSRE